MCGQKEMRSKCVAKQRVSGYVRNGWLSNGIVDMAEGLVTQWKDGWLSRECIRLRSGISCGVQEWWGPSTGLCLEKEWVTTYQAEGWVAKKSDGWLGRGMVG